MNCTTEKWPQTHGRWKQCARRSKKSSKRESESGLQRESSNGKKESPRIDNTEERTKTREVAESSALTTLARSDSSRRSKTAPTCSLCQKPYRNNECPQFKTRDSRMEILRELKLCFTCLRNGHHAKACRNKLRPCFKCQGKQQTAICPDSGQKKESEQVQTTIV